MGRNDDMQLYEPEGLDPQAPLEGEARAHRDLHLALEAAGREWKGRVRATPSADFDERLLARLNASTEADRLAVNEQDFAPVVGAGEAALLTRRGFLAATAAIFFVAFGALWFQAYRDAGSGGLTPPAASAPASSGSANGSRDRSVEEAATGAAVPRPAHIPAPPQAPLEAPTPERPAAERAGASPTPPAPATESETQKRSVWSEDSTPDPEALLRDQIAAERNPARKKALMLQLIRLYESTGQSGKAAELRRQL